MLADHLKRIDNDNFEKNIIDIYADWLEFKKQSKYKTSAKFLDLKIEIKRLKISKAASTIKHHFRTLSPLEIFSKE